MSYFASTWITQYKLSAISYMMKGYLFGNRRAAIKNIIDIVLACIKRGQNDNMIAKQILEYLGKVSTELYIQNDRVSERASTIINLAAGQKISTYLDYGCGDGSITERVGEDLGLSKEDILGLDILMPRLQYNITYIDAMSSIPDNSVDLVTILVTLHHLGPTSLDWCMEDVARVLSPDGILIIREHDYDGSSEMRDFLNLIHVFNDVKNDQSDRYDKIDYRSREAWTQYLYIKGFYLLRTSFYESYNPQKLYYAAYGLKK